MGVNQIYYLLFATIGFYLSVTTGLYLFDVIISSFVGINLIKGRITINHQTKVIIIFSFLFLIIPSLLSISYQITTYNIFTNYSIYIPYNIVLLSIYLIFIQNTYHKSSLNENYIILLLSIPIILSLLMFFLPQFNLLMVKLYSIDAQNPFRPGGIWGKDSNQLGYYSILIFIYCLFMLKLKRINVFLALPILIICLFSNLISGMRTGLAGFVATVFIMFFLNKKKFFNIRSILLIIVFTFLLAAVIFQIIKLFNIDFYNFLTERLSFDLFINQLTGESGDGHVGNMYAKWINQFSNNDNLLDILFSFDASWKYPDSLVLFFIANNGILGIVCLYILSLIVYTLLRKTRNYITLFVLLFSIIVAFKGLYPFNNIGMFLFVILSFKYKLLIDRNEFSA